MTVLPCTRCDRPAEIYSLEHLGAASMNGHEIDDVVLCRFCEELRFSVKANPKDFFGKGWLKYGGDIPADPEPT